MDRSPSEPRELNLEQLVDAHDLRAVIAAALAASPVDERALRRGVWTYVVAERVVGTPPGYVIMSLTQIVDASGIMPDSRRQTLTRRVILWCVEAYFGHLGGERAGAGEESAEGREVPPMMVSNR
jgi:hypothetical protein